MRFVPVKSEDQQATLMLHSARELLISQRTALINALRGHFAELGIVAPQGARNVRQLIATLEEDRGSPETVRIALMNVPVVGRGVGSNRFPKRRTTEVARRSDTSKPLDPMQAGGPPDVARRDAFHTCPASASSRGISPKMRISQKADREAATTPGWPAAEIRTGADPRADESRAGSCTRAWPQCGRPFKMTVAKLRLAQAAMGKPETKAGELCAALGTTRQTLYRFVGSKGELRADEKTARSPQAPRMTRVKEDHRSGSPAPTEIFF